jgi:hypothetical protein
MRKLWQKAPDPKARQIASKERAPRISTIFDFSGAVAQFQGPDADAPDEAVIVGKLHGPPADKHLDWAVASTLDFTEKLWLATARSDNLGAATCVSEIGVAYIKAIQRAYGLFVDDVHSPMRLLEATGHHKIEAKRVSPRTALTYRPLQNLESQRVEDAIKDRNGHFTDHRSSIGGSAAALLAYMIALQQDKLTSFGHTAADLGKAGCNTIRHNVSTDSPLTTRSAIEEGVKTTGTVVTKQLSKIGLLGTEDGEPDDFNCEWAYLETKEPGAAGKVKKYGVVATGIRLPLGSHDDIDTYTHNLAAAIHTALLTV